MRILKKVLLTVSATVFAFTASVTPAALPQTQIVAEAATMKLNKKSMTLEEGETYKLKVKGKGKKKVKWSSSDEDIVMVTSSGKIIAVEEGTATVKAKVGKKTFRCKVYVEAKDDDAESTEDTNENNDSGTEQQNDQKNTQVVEKSYFQRLKDYVYENGSYSSSGKQVQFNYEKDSSAISLSIKEDSSTDTILFTYGAGIENTAVGVAFGTDSTGITPIVTSMSSYNGINMYKATSYDLNAATYVKGVTKLDFHDDIGVVDSGTVNEYSNEFFEQALDLFDVYLKSKLGFGLKELGFTNL